MKSLKHHMSYQYWTVAFRNKKEDRFIYEEKLIPDLQVINQWKTKIQADPFLFKYQDKNYLFYERAGAFTEKGKIMCVCLDDKKRKSRTVLKESFHLSYPCIFQIKDHIYMIPETKQNKALRVYQAVDFPFTWKLYREIENIATVDSTLFEVNGNQILFTYQQNRLCLFQCHLDSNGVVEQLELLTEQEVSKQTRPGGMIIDKGDYYLRPAQNCEKFYGKELIFYRFKNNEMNHFTEKEYCCLNSDQIKMKGDPIIGVHTYNYNEDYEVIDLLRKECHPGVLFKKLFIVVISIIYEKLKTPSPS